jgi:DNA-binding transcriptional LysR family regulator
VDADDRGGKRSRARAGEALGGRRLDRVGRRPRGIPPARWLARHAPAAAPVLKPSHIATQVAAVREGLGVALLPLVYLQVATIAPLPYVRALEPSVRDLPINETWLVGHKALRNVPRVAAVWALILDEFQHFEEGAATRRKPDIRRKQTV